MSITAKNLLSQLRGEIPEITPQEAEDRIKSGTTVVDVREADEFSTVSERPLKPIAETRPSSSCFTFSPEITARFVPSTTLKK